MSMDYRTSIPAHYPSAALSGVADADAFKIGNGTRIHRPAHYVSTADIHPLSGAALNISAPVRVVSVCGTYANAPIEGARAAPPFTPPDGMSRKAHGARRAGLSFRPNRLRRGGTVHDPRR